MKLLVVYHSGVGNTKLIAEMIWSRLKETFVTDISAVEDIKDMSSTLDYYDGYIIGFPTYHTHPSISIIEFINNCETLGKSKPAYIFTTCAMFSANTLRIFAKMCLVKNVIPVQYRSYRCAATDGTLLMPYIKALFTIEKNLDKKVEAEVQKIKTIFSNRQPIVNLPPFSLMSILNFPNKKVGQFITLKIFLHKDKCNKCGQCIRNCNRNAMRPDQDQYPLFIKNQCEKCFRCIHHCPNKALSLSKRHIPKKQLNEEFFKNQST